MPVAQSRPTPTPAQRAAFNRPQQQPAQPLNTASRLAEIRRRRAEEHAGLWASKDQRNKWVMEVTPLWLHKVSYVERGYGGKPSWTVTVSENDPGSEQLQFSMSSNPWRDEVMSDIEAEITADPTPIGPVALVEVDTKSGQKALDIQEWSEDMVIPF